MEPRSSGLVQPLLAAVALALTALVVAFAGSARAGTIVADTGFRPDPNGFSFENYGDNVPYKNLNSAEMVRMFGRSVCIGGKRGKCVLSAPARNWMNAQNTGMSGGHCYGFAALSELISKGKLPQFGYPSLASFGPAPVPFGLSIEGNVRLQRSIARAWAFQTLPAIEANRVLDAPNRILDLLIQGLTPENPQPLTMLIFQRGFQGGHAITPYAVEDMGGGVFDVHVYDNNWPGDADRRLTIDTKANTWRYYAAVNPGFPDAEYEGDAKSKTLGIDQTLPALRTQSCFFCGRRGLNSRFNEIRLDSFGTQSAHLLITDTKGRRTGFLEGRFVNRIPGVKVIHRTSGGIAPDPGDGQYLDTLEPVYKVPKNVKFNLRIDGRGMTEKAKQSLSLVGPTYDATLADLSMGPDQVAHVWLSPKGNALTYRASKRTRRPTVSFGAESRKASYSISAMQVGAKPGTKFKFVKSTRYQLMYLGDEARDKVSYVIRIQRYDRKGESEAAAGVTIRGRQQAFLYYGPLADPRGVAKIIVYKPGREKVRVIPVE